MVDLYTNYKGKSISIFQVREMIMRYKEEFKKAGMSQYGANSLIRLAAYRAGEFWVKVFLPKRFDPAYARGVLGYSSGVGYETWKKDHAGQVASWKEYRGFAGPYDDLVQLSSPQPSPYVLSGASKQTVLSGTPNIVVREAAGKGSCVVTYRLGKIAFKKAKSFTYVPAVEYQRFSQEFERHLKQMITPMVRSGAFPKDFQFTADKRGVTYDERIVSHVERRIG